MAHKSISGKEVFKHNSRESCWIIVHGSVMSPEIQQTNCVNQPLAGMVYDVTGFLDGTFVRY